MLDTTTNPKHCLLIQGSPYRTGGWQIVGKGTYIELVCLYHDLLGSIPPAFRLPMHLMASDSPTNNFEKVRTWIPEEAHG